MTKKNKPQIDHTASANESQEMEKTPQDKLELEKRGLEEFPSGVIGYDEGGDEIYAEGASRFPEHAQIHLAKALSERGLLQFGKRDPAHRFFWRGNDINGNNYEGSGDDASQCNVDAGLQGSSTCHLRPNPDFIEPLVAAPVVEAPPTPRELNAFYNAGYGDGHAEGFRFFEDLKTAVLAWATEQNLSGGLPDVESLPFVVFARYNP